jgi:hypothetical protein
MTSVPEGSDWLVLLAKTFDGWVIFSIRQGANPFSGTMGDRSAQLAGLNAGGVSQRACVIAIQESNKAQIGRHCHGPFHGPASWALRGCQQPTLWILQRISKTNERNPRRDKQVLL